jgi:hypothetical protein
MSKLRVFLGGLTAMAVPQSVYAYFSMQAEYECACVELAAMLPYSLEKVKDAVFQVAVGTTHPNHLVPSHLQRLIQNKWLVEGTPKHLHLQVLLGHPVECSQGCLKRFYELLGEEA